MHRYYLHLHDGRDIVEDEEGIICANEGELHAFAINCARDVMVDQVRNGFLRLRDCIRVCDETGSLVRLLNFSEAVELDNC